MGIYDRDYARGDEAPGFLGTGERTMVVNILLATVAVFVVQMLFDAKGFRGAHPVSEFLALKADFFSLRTLTHPWEILNLVSYGFVHSRDNIWHILGNMFFFWFFGRDVEARYGKREFLSIYLTAIVIAGLAWIASSNTFGGGGYLVGASGGVMGIILINVLHNPWRTILIWGVLPVPAWGLAAVYLLSDIYGTFRPGGTNVAYVAHLGGAAYGYAYYRTRWSLRMLLPRNFSLKAFAPKPKLRVHDPDAKDDAKDDEVDDILRKIKEQGQDSLTARERKLLARASRRYQQKHR